MGCEVVFAPRSAVTAAHEQLLTARERGRWSRFRRAEDRDRYLLATVVLKAAIGRRVGVPVSEVVVDRSCVRCGAPHGRPRVVGHPLEVSLSHSGELVAVALSDVGAVGVDVEVVAARRTASLVRFVCTPAERDAVDSDVAFTTTWARKESVLKAVGVGLRVPMTQVVVSAPGQPPALLAYRGGTLLARMQDLVPDEGEGGRYAGCVTVLGRGALDVTFPDPAEVLASL